MEQFKYYAPTKILFGKNTEAEVGVTSLFGMITRKQESKLGISSNVVD